MITLFDDASDALGVDRQVGMRLRAARLSKALSEDQLARQLGIAPLLLRDFERGSVRANTAQLFEIANALDLPVAKFYEGLDIARLS